MPRLIHRYVHHSISSAMPARVGGDVVRGRQAKWHDNQEKKMAIEFLIDHDPPSRDDIVRELDRAQRERALFRKKNYQFLMYMIVIVASILGFILFVAIPRIKEPDADQDLVFMFTYAMPYVLFAVFIISNNIHIKKIEKPSKALDAVIKGLQEVTEEDLDNGCADWREYEAVRVYREKVDAMGRSLVQAEVDAIVKWVESGGQAESPASDAG